MTLILGMSKADGIYISADYRVTDARSGRLIDDATIKLLAIHYAVEGGPKALLGYTGIAILPDGTPTGTWIRETLRGKSESANESFAHLRARLDRDIARLRIPLVVNVLAIEANDRRWFGALSNLKDDRSVLNSFEYMMSELRDPFAFANGSGAARVVADRHLDLLRSQLAVRPRKTADHLKLLAQVNRRVAKSDPRKTVSPFCHVSFINADARAGPESMISTEKGETVPFAMPVLVQGVDLTEMMSQFEAWTSAAHEGNAPPAPDYTDIDLERRP